MFLAYPVNCKVDGIGQHKETPLWGFSFMYRICECFSLVPSIAKLTGSVPHKKPLYGVFHLCTGYLNVSRLSRQLQN